MLVKSRFIFFVCVLSIYFSIVWITKAEEGFFSATADITRNASTEGGNWLTLSKWESLGNASQIATVILIIILLYQLRIMEKDGKHRDAAGIIERIMQHNWEIIKDKKMKEAVRAFEGLNVPNCDEQSDLYWATRAVHLSHINLLWQIWELSGRPKPKETFPEFLEKLRTAEYYKKSQNEYTDWNRFAKLTVEELASVPGDRPQAYSAAVRDLWKGLHTYELAPKGFIEWLDSLSSKK